MKTLPWLVLALLFSIETSWPEDKIEDYSFLDAMDIQPVAWVPEQSPSVQEKQRALDIDMKPFYEDFATDGIITFFVGYGNEGYYPERGEQIFEMLKAMGAHFNLQLTDWALTKDADKTTIGFRDAGRNLSYFITVQGERNAFADAFSRNEVVMYHGHSRYGRGPAFGKFENYFRMGHKHRTVEVDARNPYFKTEPILRTRRYPAKNLSWDGEALRYQYRGPKSDESYLAEDSYTKNIPGRSTDLVRAGFLPGRQIFYFYSCLNRDYWRKPIRDLHPDPNRKLVFGTYKIGYGSTKPEAVMIMSVVRQLSKTTSVLRDLNATRDCDNCFTAY